MAHFENCPTCGTKCRVSWAGLELVANSGDETLATKCYEPIVITASSEEEKSIIAERIAQALRQNTELDFKIIIAVLDTIYDLNCAIIQRNECR